MNIPGKPNRCKEAGCNAACCVGLIAGMPKREFKRFSRGIQVDKVSPDSFGIISALIGGRNAKQVVFASEHRANGKPRVRIGISGPCPHVNLISGDCKVYRKRPDACRELQINSPRCLEAQKINGKK